MNKNPRQLIDNNLETLIYIMFGSFFLYTTHEHSYLSTPHKYITQQNKTPLNKKKTPQEK